MIIHCQNCYVIASHSHANLGFSRTQTVVCNDLLLAVRIDISVISPRCAP
jgi:hypothetical protein